MEVKEPRAKQCLALHPCGDAVSAQCLAWEGGIGRI